jgi:dipicolinate synthase subunit B
VQDDPISTPHSLVADFSLVPEALEAALAGRQMRPIFLK